MASKRARKKLTEIERTSALFDERFVGQSYKKFTRVN